MKKKAKKRFTVKKGWFLGAGVAWDKGTLNILVPFLVIVFDFSPQHKF